MVDTASDPDPPRLTLRYHGYPSVVLNGTSIDLRLKHGLALLLLLLEGDHRLARGQVAEILWPDAAADVARARLRRLCHEMNAVIGATVLVGDTDTVSLSAEIGPPTSDVMEVRHAARSILSTRHDRVDREALSRLLSPRAQLVAEGLSLPSEAFAAWLDTRRSDLLGLLMRALAWAGQRLCDEGDAEMAQQCARRLIVLEPLADVGHALLLAAQAMRADAAAVEAAYFACADLMRNEFGMRPSARIEAAYAAANERIRTGSMVTGAEADRQPQICFADADDGAVAYLAIGAGEVTVIILFGLWSHVEVAWEEEGIRNILKRLAQRWRVVLMDRRGTGLSERLGVRQSLKTGVDDVEAVRRAIGVEKVWLLGNSAGGTIAIEYAHQHREHLSGLLLFGTAARSTWAPDYPWALTQEQLDRWLEALTTAWGQSTSWQQFAPSMAADPAARDWWARMMRQALSRNSLKLVLQAFAAMDVRHRLPHLNVPTLVLQRAGDLVVRQGAARYLAHHIAGAQLVILPGSDHVIWCGDTSAVLAEIERFIAGHRPTELA